MGRLVSSVVIAACISLLLCGLLFPQFGIFLLLGTILVIIMVFAYSSWLYHIGNRNISIISTVIPLTWLVWSVFSSQFVNTFISAVVGIFLSVVIASVFSIVVLSSGEFFIRYLNYRFYSRNMVLKIAAMTLWCGILIGMVVPFSSPVINDNYYNIPDTIQVPVVNITNTSLISPVVYQTTIPTTIPTIKPTVVSTPVSEYHTGPVTKNFSYIFNSKSYTSSIQMYSGVYNKIILQPTPIQCWRYPYDATPCNDQELERYYSEYINNSIQDEELTQLVDSIRDQSPDRNIQARIAVRLVQNIPYDIEGYNNIKASNGSGLFYPYETLYKNQGVCSDKSILLVYLLDKLGFETVIFQFSPENHAAVGIKCDPEYGYKGTGYCFVETTNPSIITDSSAEYTGVGKLKSEPILYHMSSGLSISGIEEEYEDAIRYDNIVNTMNSYGNILETYENILEPYETRAELNGNTLGGQEYADWKVKYDAWKIKYSEWEALNSELQALNKKYGFRLINTD